MLDGQSTPPGHQSGLRILTVLLALAAIGLPVNTQVDYAVLVLIAVLAFTGVVTTSPRAFAGALALVLGACVAQMLITVPRLQEGHNVFLPGEALERALPGQVYQALLAEFDAVYPPAVRCDGKDSLCWQGQARPDRAYAFSADSVWHRSDASRAVTSVDFTDPVWLRLGFANEVGYNWSTPAPDVRRSDRDKRFWMGFARWHMVMPWYEMVQLPAGFAGGELCWRGDLLWEGEGGRFSRWRGDSCRPIEERDAGKRVFGLGIKPDTLAMQVSPPLGVQALLGVKRGIAFIAAFGVILLLVRYEKRRLIVPLSIIGLALLVIAIDDASFIGGLRPMDGGDDGLFYDGVGRLLLRKLLDGDWRGFLEGNEPVYYYGGPGLRYFRALEHVVFGETFLGYLTLVLTLPFAAWCLFRRFTEDRYALALTFLFVAIPVGTLFGTSFVQYQKWASRGFADPAAYIFFIAGMAVLVGARAPLTRFPPAFFAALLLAAGIFMKPIVAPAAAVLLGGAGLAALYQRQWWRLAGLCIGFLPVFTSALHNWVFGHVFVLFSSNAQHADVLVMPPSAYARAFGELLHLQAGDHLRHAVTQIADWLGGPAESWWTIPLNAGGVIVLVWVVLRGRTFDPWLRLIGAAALAQHTVAFFYTAATARYHFLTWFMTMLVVMAWFHDVGIVWLARRYPSAATRIANHRGARQLAAFLTRLQKASA